MRSLALGFGVAFVLALVEARVLLTEIDQRWLVLLALGTGAAAALLGVRKLSAGSSLALAAIAAGDITTYPYCAGRVAPERWLWFGGDPVSTIAVSSRGFG